MNVSSHTFDVCVIGGGPAGAVSAGRLSEFGLRVALLEGVTRTGWSCGYSIPLAAAHWLHAIGWGEAFAQANPLPLDGSLLRWSQATSETRESTSFVVEPQALAVAMRAQAVRQGVTLLQPVKVRDVNHDAAGWHVQCATGESLNARLLVDATGRRSKFAGPRHAHLPRTAALIASFQNVPLPAHRQCNEALADGWLWGAPLPDGRWAVAMFTDPARLQGLDETQRWARLQDWLAASELLRPCLQGSLSTPPLVCDATGERAREVATPTLLRVGDAALTLDPLSSQGVFAAARSAWQGAAAVRTILQRPAQTAAAIAFHELHIQNGATHNRSTAGELYASVHDRFAAAPFWAARAVTPSASLRASRPLQEAVPLRMAPQAALRSAPVLTEGWIEETLALHAPALTLPTAYLGEVALAPLIRMIEPGCTGAELMRRWVKRLPLTQCQALLNWLWQSGVVEPV